MRRPTVLLARAAERLPAPLKRMWPRRSDRLLAVLAAGIIGLALTSYLQPVEQWASRIGSGSRFLSVAATYFSPLRNPQTQLHAGLPIYDLRIRSRQYARIERAVRAARKRGWMSEEEKSWASATFMADGQRYNAKVRVRGDLPNHWSGPKKSWRIKLLRSRIPSGTGEEERIYFHGMREFDLIIPRDRDYVVAPFVDSLMREAGLVVPRDGFAILRINGRLEGLYYRVERFLAPMLAANARADGPIFGLNDRPLHFAQYTRLGTPVAADAALDLGSVRVQGVSDDPATQRALEVLYAFARNPTPETFRRARLVVNWHKYMEFRNVTTLFNTNHVRFGSDNLKLYYDPTRGQLEPIPWDVHLVRMPDEPGTIDYFNSHGPDPLERATLMDPKLRLQRNRMLWATVRDGGQDLIDAFRAFSRRIRQVAWSDPLSRPTNADNMDVLASDFDHNVRRVHKVLGFSSANVTFRRAATDRASLDVTALNFSGILLDDIRLTRPGLHGSYELYEDVDGDGALGASDTLLATTQAKNGVLELPFDSLLVLPEVRYEGDFIDGRYWEYFAPHAGRRRFFLVGELAGSPSKVTDPKDLFTSWTPPGIDVSARNAVTHATLHSAPRDADDRGGPEASVAVTAYDASAPFDLDAITLRRSDFLRAHPQFTARADRTDGVELSGRVTIRGTVIVPVGVPLLLRPGTDLAMGPGASIVTYGGLEALGSGDQPIRIHGGEANRAWGTLAAVRPGREVVLRHVFATGGEGARVNGILFSGAVAVHQGDLRMEVVSITNMKGEDALNLKNGRLEMVRSVLRGNASDAVDLDFATGSVRESLFLDNGNDGLDISGSRVAVEDSRFEGNGDKGFSVGEDSHPTVVNSLFLRNQIGISIKDLSSAHVTHSTFVANRIGVEAKRKKPEFGPGRGRFEESVFVHNARTLDEDSFSVGGVAILSSILDQDMACQGCRLVQQVRFRDPAAGDYRLRRSDVPGAGADAGADITVRGPPPGDHTRAPSRTTPGQL